MLQSLVVVLMVEISRREPGVWAVEEDWPYPEYWYADIANAQNPSESVVKICYGHHFDLRSNCSVFRFIMWICQAARGVRFSGCICSLAAACARLASLVLSALNNGMIWIYYPISRGHAVPTLIIFLILPVLRLAKKLLRL